MCEWHLSLWRCKHTDETITKCPTQRHYENWHTQERRHVAKKPKERDWARDNHERLYGDKPKPKCGVWGKKTRSRVFESEPQDYDCGKENRERGLINQRRRHDWGEANREKPLGFLSSFMPNPCEVMNRAVERFEEECAACRMKADLAMGMKEVDRTPCEFKRDSEGKIIFS
ncbi:MAG: hypothetical protein M1815_002859 [Lichina confinis]|nr:MAG: hypothetical protein M1815_002859 [Lichina confinis]